MAVLVAVMNVNGVLLMLLPCFIALVVLLLQTNRKWLVNTM